MNKKSKLLTLIALFLSFGAFGTSLGGQTTNANAETNNIQTRAKRTAVFNSVSIYCNNVLVPNYETQYSQVILEMGTYNVDFLSDSHSPSTTNYATSDHELGSKLTINGVAISTIYKTYNLTHVGYDHGYNYLYIRYPVDAHKSFGDYIVPTIHCEAGTPFEDVLLPEINIKFVGNSWIKTDASDFKIDEPTDFTSYLFGVTLPHQVTNSPHAVLANVPNTGVNYAFTINTGNADLTDTLSCFAIDGLYKTRISFYLGSNSIHLYDTAINNPNPIEIYQGFIFEKNTTYLLEIDFSGNNDSSTIKFAVNHLLIFNHTFNYKKIAKCDVWMVDYFNTVVLNDNTIFEENPFYEPVINYGGSSSYDFLEGDSVINFATMVTSMNMYDDQTVGQFDFAYQEGAVTEGKYNAGTWTLTITLTLGDLQSVTIVTIYVHGKTTMAKVYFGDNNPIDVPVGSKLTKPTDPQTYRQGENDYVFEDWYFNGGKWNFETDVVNGDMHLIAKFRAIPLHYKVTAKFVGLDKIDEVYSLTKGTALPFSLFAVAGATYEVFVGDNPITLLIVQEDITITVKYTVAFTYVAPVEPTCTTDGNVGYYYSQIYEGYYFLDPNGREVIDDPILPKLNHDIVHLDYKDSTCCEVGNVDCYYCKNCGKHFFDEDGTNIMVNWSIKKKDHVKQHHDAVQVTCETDGCIEYWTCENEPGVYYKNSSMTSKVDSPVIPALGHDYRDPVYEWIETVNGYQCKATITCTHCENKIIETRDASKIVARESTCTKEGQIYYSVRFDNEKFSAQTKLITVAKLAHNYVHFDEIPATKDTDGVMEHYECSVCHACFVKVGDDYVEVDYTNLIIKAGDNGCGGSIATSSLVLLMASSVLVTLVAAKRKEDR